MPVARVAFEARIIYALHRRMVFQECCYPVSAVVLIPHSQRKSFHAAMEEKDGMRVHRTAKMIELFLDLSDQIGAPDTGTGNNIRVSVKIFRSAMNREVKAVFDGPKIDRACKRIVDDGNESMLASKSHNGLEIDNVEQRIRHGFDVNRPCIWPQSAFPRIGIVRLNKIIAETK